MEIKDSYELPLSKERVWAALNDEQFLKKSIFILFLSMLVCSCHEENNFKWENAVISSEKDAIIISSFDIVSLIQKSNLSENEELNLKLSGLLYL